MSAERPDPGWTALAGSPTRLLRARTADGQPVDPRDVDPAGKPGYGGDKAEGRATLAGRAEHVAELQELLYANGRTETGAGHSLLLVIQAMDTAGKGGILRHVVGSMDPQGVRDVAFKRPTEHEQQHDFLWRIRPHVPESGMISVFDRSHYEDVLVHRVRRLSPLEVVERRYEQIRGFEQELAEAGTQILKVMLHLSKDEQKQRLAKRLDRPDKHWKYEPGDVDERAFWDDYMEAYRIAIAQTDADHAPWYIVPADRKWYSRLAVQELLIDALEGMDLRWPAADFDVEREKRRLSAS